MAEELQVDIAPFNADEYITMVHVLQAYPRSEKTAITSVAKDVVSILKRTDERFKRYEDREMYVEDSSIKMYLLMKTFLKSFIACVLVGASPSKTPTNLHSARLRCQ